MRHFGQAIWADEAVRLAEKPSDGLFVRRTDDDAAHQRPKALPRPLPYKMRVAATTSPIPVQHRAEGSVLLLPPSLQSQPRPRPFCPVTFAPTVQAWNFLHFCVPRMHLEKVWKMGILGKKGRFQIG